MNLRNYLMAAIFAICVGCFLCIRVYAATDTIQIKIPKTRIEGSDRYKTSIEISKSKWEDGSCKVALLTTGENYPDALSAAPLAKKFDAPILLTNKYLLTSDTENELYRLGVKTVYIIGGTGVVSSYVEGQLKSMNIAAIRLGGADRYETSIKIAEQLSTPKQLAVTTGDDFSDALSIAPFAALENMPIILVPKEYVPECVKNYLSSINIDKTYIVGGTDIISDTVSKSFNNPYRIGGTDKYERNINVIRTFLDDIYWGTIYIATGNNFPDALSGSAIAAKDGSSIVLVGNEPTTEAKDFINKNKDLITNCKILGGEEVISSTTLNALLPPDYTIDKESFRGTRDIYENLGFVIFSPKEAGWIEFSSTSNSTDIIFEFFKSGKDNDYLLCTVDGISADSSIKTGKDYLSLALNSPESKNYTVTKNIYSLTLGGRNFDVLDIKGVAKDGSEYNRRIYSTVKKNYVLSFYIQYTDADSFNGLSNILNTIEFAK